MDISDITKEANRKRINVDIEKLQEKVSRETTNIIKTKVEQDSAHWELREKLQTAEGDAERLQGALREALEQREAGAARLRDELRRRADTLSRVAAARDLATELHDSAARAAAAVRRAAADRALLAAAYERAAAAAADVARRHRDADAAQRARLAAAEAALAEKERTIAELREAPRLLLAEFTAELERGRADLARLEREVGAAAALRDAVAQAEAREARARQEAATAQERHEARERELASHLQEMKVAFDDIKGKLTRVSVENERLEGEIQERGRRASSAERALRAQVAAAEERAADATAQAERARVDLDEAVERARAEAGEAAARARAEAAAADERAAAAEREVSSRAATIARLMGELAAEGQARARDAGAAERLRDALQNKEEETAEQTKIVEGLRDDRERLQAKVTAMEATIETMQKKLTMFPGRAAAPPSTRKPPQPVAPAPVDDPLYSFFSDSSVESIDSQEVSRRFEALSRGERLPPTSLRALKRRRAPPEPQADAARARTFFKTPRRTDDKFKRHHK